MGTEQNVRIGRVDAISWADINIAQSRGDAVMGLMQRAEIVPLPVFYRLLYDYVAGVQTLDAARIGAIVDQQKPDAAGGEKLFDEFVRPYESDAALGQIVDQMLRRIQTLDAAICERREVSNASSAELSAASAGLSADDLERSLMLEWVKRLTAVNNKVRAANAELVAEADKAREELTAAQDELKRLSRDTLVDPMTSVANRKGLDSALSSAIADAHDTGRPLALAVVDVDRFKQFNDQYGHQVGDAILKLVARAVMATLRASDIVGRLGGDEFVAVLPDCSDAAAIELAEAVRGAVLNCDLAPVLGKDILGGVTVSVGVASYRSGDSIAALLERADRLLLEAKGSGRNRVVCETVLEEAKAS